MLRLLVSFLVLAPLVLLARRGLPFLDSWFRRQTTSDHIVIRCPECRAENRFDQPYAFHRLL